MQTQTTLNESSMTENRLLFDQYKSEFEENNDYFRDLGQQQFYLNLIHGELFITTAAKPTHTENNDCLAINKDFKEKLIKQGIPLRTANPSHVIALQVAPTFGIIMPLISNKAIAFILITALCLIANCAISSRYSRHIHPNTLHIDHAKNTMIGLFLGIVTFGSLLDAPFYWRSLAVATMVTGWCWLSSQLAPLINWMENRTTPLMKPAAQWWLNIGLQQFASIFLVMCSLYGVSQYPEMGLALSCAVKTLSASTVITLTDVVVKRLKSCQLFANRLRIDPIQNPTTNQSYEPQVLKTTIDPQ